MPRSAAPRVELFGRAIVTGGRTRQRAIADRLDTLCDADRIADVTTHAWHGRVRTPVVDDDATGAVEWYDRFAAWAERNDAALEPFFAHRERESAFAGTSYEEYVFPVLAIAVVRDGEVTEVAPRVTCTGEQVSVWDVVDRLDAAVATAEEPDTAPVAR